LAIAVLLECDVRGAAKILGLTWDETWDIQERAVKRGQARKGQWVVPTLGVDEKAAGDSISTHANSGRTKIDMNSA